MIRASMDDSVGEKFDGISLGKYIVIYIYIDYK